MAYGASSAAGVVVGKCVGGGRQEELPSVVKTLEVLFVGIGLISGLALFLASGPLLALMRANLTDRAQVLSRQFMTILSLTTVGTAYQMACDHGIIRGGGDTAFSAKMNLISMWLIVVPFSAMTAFWWELPRRRYFFC